jgi:hypothetical protein
MARWWSEPLDPEKHHDFMSSLQIGGIPAEAPRTPFIKTQVYFVAVAGFTFQFVSLAQLSEALAYFEQESRSPNRRPGVKLEHYWQMWYERLPQWLFEERRRVKVASALRKARAAFASDPEHSE